MYSAKCGITGNCMLLATESTRQHLTVCCQFHLFYLVSRSLLRVAISKKSSFCRRPLTELGVCQVRHNEKVKQKCMKWKKFVTHKSQRGEG